ncbi:hypothetical protein B0H15DRAFT_854172 [Mycena belliarum]|uniref:Uncharacterized protein n=1 Tax=Mycena belliarum TaxID=1033014 RepID=A0AAD6U1H3_9AGAR|nr:hypothetical protein B0H15DRAFT_854172 [Mycena belliae]
MRTESASKSRPCLIPMRTESDKKSGMYHPKFRGCGRHVLMYHRSSGIGLATLARLVLAVADQWSRDDGLEIMPFLTRPALKGLTLVDRYSPTWISTRFTGFQLRSPHIESLTIDCSSLSLGDVLEVLRHAPSLTKLRLLSCVECFDDEVIEGLEYSEANGMNLAPRIEELTVSDVDEILGEDALCAMIGSRLWTDAQLLALPTPPKVARWSVIKIRCRGEGPVVSEAKLSDYQAQGLKIRVYRFSPESLQLIPNNTTHPSKINSNPFKPVYVN